MASILTLLLVIFTTFPSSSHAGEIYKWVDEHGRVHYSDKPDARNSDQLSIKTEPSSPALVSDEERRIKRDRLLEVFREDREQARINATEQESNKATYQSNCNIARTRLEQIQQSQYLFAEDTAGERVIFSESERNAEVERVRSDIENWCNYAKP